MFNWESGIGNRESGIGNREQRRGKRQEARGKRQEARGKRQEARGKRQEARGKRQQRTVDPVGGMGILPVPIFGRTIPILATDKTRVSPSLTHPTQLKIHSSFFILHSSFFIRLVNPSAPTNLFPLAHPTKLWCVTGRTVPILATDKTRVSPSLTHPTQLKIHSKFFILHSKFFISLLPFDLFSEAS